MRRRNFITLLGGAAAAWPLAARAQQAAVPVIGVLHGTSAAEWAGRMAGFRRALGEMGFVEGRNIAFEYRWAEGQYDRLPSMAVDLVARNVAVMLVGVIPAVRAAMAATQTIPIVFTTTTDPIEYGLVASLNRPGGNVTGVTSMATELLPKSLELLHEAIPAVGKFALLANPNNPVTVQGTINAAQMAARRLNIEMVVLYAGNMTEIEGAFESAVHQRVSAVILNNDAYLLSQRDQIAALALRHGLPTVGGQREAVTAGMLMSYSASDLDSYRQAGVYVGRILKGEKPADLPVMRPARFELIVNLKTAKAIGLTIPETFLVRADEVIE
jgi:putative ABC transport system substrate-binding protein